MKTKEECPGEFVCTTDIEIGRCARQNLTLETLCKPSRCSLYFTKRDSTPKQYEAALDSAIRQTERQLSGFAVKEKKLSAYEVEAKIVFDRATRIVENEKQEEEDAKRSNDSNKGEPGRGFIKGDSNAFAFSDDQLRKMYEARNKRQRKRQEKQERRKRARENAFSSDEGDD